MNAPVCITQVIFLVVISTCSTAFSLLRSSVLLKKQSHKQYYTYAGILPIQHTNNGTYVILCKVKSNRNKEIYADFGSAPLKQDGNNPLITATRSFCEKTNICYETLFNIIKKQCTQNSCVLKSNTGRILFYPIELSIREFPHNQQYEYVSLSQLQKAVDQQKQPIILKSRQGMLCTLEHTLVQALIHNRDTTKNTQAKSIFERYLYRQSK